MPAQCSPQLQLEEEGRRELRLTDAERRGQASQHACLHLGSTGRWDALLQGQDDTSKQGEERRGEERGDMAANECKRSREDSEIALQNDCQTRQ